MCSAERASSNVAVPSALHVLDDSIAVEAAEEPGRDEAVEMPGVSARLAPVVLVDPPLLAADACHRDDLVRQLGLSGYWVDAGHVVRARSRGGGELVDPLVDDEVIDELVTGLRPTPFRSERLILTAVAPEEEIREKFAASGCGRKEYPALRRSPTARNAG